MSSLLHCISRNRLSAVASSLASKFAVRGVTPSFTPFAPCLSLRAWCTCWARSVCVLECALKTYFLYRFRLRRIIKYENVSITIIKIEHTTNPVYAVCFLRMHLINLIWTEMCNFVCVHQDPRDLSSKRASRHNTSAKHPPRLKPPVSKGHTWAYLCSQVSLVTPWKLIPNTWTVCSVSYTRTPVTEHHDIVVCV